MIELCKPTICGELNRKLQTCVAIIKAKPVEALEVEDIAIQVSDLSVGCGQPCCRLCLSTASGVAGSDVWQGLRGDIAVNHHSTRVPVDSDIDRVEVGKR